LTPHLFHQQDNKANPNPPQTKNATGGTGIELFDTTSQVWLFRITEGTTIRNCFIQLQLEETQTRMAQRLLL